MELPLSKEPVLGDWKIKAVVGVRMLALALLGFIYLFGGWWVGVEGDIARLMT